MWLNTVSIGKPNILYLVDVCVVLMSVVYGFTKRSFVTFMCIISSFVFNCQEISILLLIILVFNSTVAQTSIPKVERINPCNLLLHQVILSFCYPVVVFCFIFASRMCVKKKHLKKKHLSHGKWNNFT